MQKGLDDGKPSNVCESFDTRIQKIWRRNPKEQSKKEQSEEENHHVYKVDQINEVDVVDEGTKEPSRKEDLRSVPILF